MFVFLLSKAFSKNVDATEFDIHGQVKQLKGNNDGWAYFTFGFGDFGHNVISKAYLDGNSLDIYCEYDHAIPNSTSTKINGSFYFNHPSQNVICGINPGEDKQAIVSVTSLVRPVHINSSTCLIFSIYLFFSINFIVSCVMQWIYFSNSMDPREYIPIQ